MLFRQRDFDCVRTVIFDEVHYLGDEERGSAWEEAHDFAPSPHQPRLFVRHSA